MGADRTPVLVTERLVLVPLGTDVITARLRSECFSIELAGLGLVAFDAEFPGDLLPVFPLWLAATPHSGIVPATWTVVERASLRAVGALGATSRPQHDGDDVEVGYGVNPFDQDRGVASEALREVCTALLDGRVDLGHRIGGITARTRASNGASQRVLEKCGFQRHGLDDSRDEPLVLWRLADR